MFIHICLYVHTYIHRYIGISLSLYIYIYIHICIYNTHTDINTNKTNAQVPASAAVQLMRGMRTPLAWYIYWYVYIYIYIHIHMYREIISLSLYIYIYMYYIFIHLCIYIYTHTHASLNHVDTAAAHSHRYINDAHVPWMPRYRRQNLPVSVNSNNTICVILGHATQRQKLQASPRFDAIRAGCPTCRLIRRRVFFTDTGIIHHC